MKNSKRFNELVIRIDFLRDNLLPIIRLDGEYTDLELDLTRSFILLVHAEIENYLEDKVDEKIDIAFHQWKTTRKKSNILNSIIAFCNYDLNNSNNGKHSKHDKENLEYRLNLYVKKYKSIIFGNHGIKKENILSLLLPIGIEKNDIDDTWLETMENFGSDRGKIAHKKISLQSFIDPETIKNEIYTNIVPTLKHIDYKLIKLC